MIKLAPKARALWLGIAIGIIYGLFLRWLSDNPMFSATVSVMSFTFLFLGSFAIGAVSIQGANQSALSSFFWPAIPLVFGCIFTFIFNMEGLICILMYLPVGIVCAGLGGLFGRYLLRRKSRRQIYAILFLPFFSAPIESHLVRPTRITQVETTVDIRAAPSMIWNEIKSVRPISKAEMPDSWVHKMGFPRPLEAVIDHEGVGGVRLAKFEGQLTFHERVTDWQPDRELSFTIHVDPHSIPPTTLDDHVTIGGPFFDVLDGSYRIEPLANGWSRLHLISHFRLSTNFNFYSAIWVQAVMNRIQGDIMNVIRNRSERL